MSAKFGTLSALDTLAQIRNTTVAQYGEDRTFEAISLALRAHDAVMTDMLSEMAEFTSDQLRYSGAVSQMEAEELDEFGRPAPQKVTAGDNLGFPLRRFGNALQWTRDWLNLRTPAELAAQTEAIMSADRRNIIRAIKRAIHHPTGYSYQDVFANNITIPVKPLANADSFPILPGPDGESFDASTHTHYLFQAGDNLTQADVVAAIATVREHVSTGEVVLDINQAQEAAVRGFTDFTPYVDARVVVSSDVTRGVAALDVNNIYDRAIGILQGAEVWVRPWAMNGYIIARHRSPFLAFRTREGVGAGTLELVADIDSYPLRAQMWRREFGVGVANRVGAAVLYCGKTAYTAPSSY